MVTRRVIHILTLATMSSVLSLPSVSANGCQHINIINGRHEFSEPYAVNQNKCFVFTGSADKRLRITPTELSMDTTPFCTGDYITVTDDVTGDYYGTFCGPDCTSSNSVVASHKARVTFVTDGITESGVTYHGINVIVEELPNDARAGTTCPCSAGCTWLTKDYDYIHSFNFGSPQPHFYPNDIDTYYDIPEATGGQFGLVISFESFALEVSPNCGNDYVTISAVSSGGEIQEYIRACGCLPLVTFAPGYNKIRVHFKASHHENLGGWQYYYNRKATGITADQSGGDCRCHKNLDYQCTSSKQAILGLESCGKVVTGPTPLEGLILSPGYPNGYPNDLQCRWEFHALDNHGLIISFQTFSTEVSANCANDYVKISTETGGQTTEYIQACGCLPLVSFAPGYEKVVVSFVSNNAAHPEKDGFQFYFNRGASEVTSDMAVNNCRCPVGMENQCTSGATVQHDQANCGPVVTADTEGYLTSPGWPNQYPNNVDCTWDIKADENMALVITAYVDLASSPHCAKDFMEVQDKDGGSLLRVCSVQCRPSLTTDQSTLRIRFKSNNDGETSTGFLAQYAIVPRGQSTTRVDCNPCSNQHCIVPDVCSHVIVQQQEVDRYATFEIMSPNHPNTYPANTDCVWVISAPWATKIGLQFPYGLDLELSPGCQKDYIDISNKKTGKHLMRLCGDQCAGNVVVSSPSDPQIEIRFHADETGHKSGFKATYHFRTSEPNKYDAADCGSGCAFIDDREAHGCIIPYQCDAMEGQTFGAISSPRFPYRYPPNVNCQWFIEAGPGQAIDLAFKALDLEISDNCNNDYVLITNVNNNNDVLLRVCNAGCLPHMLIHNTKISIRFVTNSDIQHYGFRLDFEVIDKTSAVDIIKCACVNDQIVGCINPLEQSSVAQPLSDNDCGELLFTAPSGTFHWPPGNIPAHKSCSYSMVGSQAKNQRISITFATWDIEPSSSKTCHDIAITYTDTSQSSSLSCITNLRDFVYLSAKHTAAITIATNNEPIGPGDGVDIRINYVITGAELQLIQDEPITELDVPPNGVIFKTSYPSTDRSLATKTWKITAPVGQQIELLFTNFNMDTGDCDRVYLMVQDGAAPVDCGPDKVCTKLCNTLHGFLWRTRPEHNVVVLKLSETREKDPYISFAIYYSLSGQLIQLGDSAQSQCGPSGIRGDCHGTVMSPNFPNNYGAGLSCVWQFQSVAGKGLLLKFSEINIRYNPECTEDLFTLQSSLATQHCTDIYSGHCFRVCKELIDVPLEVSFRGGTATIILTTKDDSQGGKGFKVDYDCYPLQESAQELSFNADDPNNIVITLGAEPSGYLTLPPYPASNPDFFKVTWVIESQPKVEGSQQIELNFMDFNMAPGGCSGANLTILSTDAAMNPPNPPTQCNGNPFCIPLCNSFGDFKWMTVASKAPIVMLQATWSKPQDSDIRMQISYGLQGSTQSVQTLNSMEQTCATTRLRGCSGVIQSPGYPNNYANELNCFWMIQADANMGLALKVVSLKIQGTGEPCTADKDVFSIQPHFYNTPCPVNGRNKCFRVCKSPPDVPFHLYYIDGQATISLHTDSTGTDQGFFRVEYSCFARADNTPAQEVVTGCGQTTLTAQNGVVESPASVTSESVDCTWYIQAPPGWTIVVTFDVIKLRTYYGCYDAEFAFQNWNGAFNCPANQYCSSVCDDSPNNPAWVSHTNEVSLRYKRRQGVQQETRVRFHWQMVAASPQQAVVAPVIQECGRRAVSMIHGGSDVEPHSWPWMGYLRGNDGSGTVACGATLIHPNWVITAAHCVQNSNGLHVDLGSHRLSVVESVQMQHPVQTVIVHPDYHDKQNDIALLRLQTPVTYSSGIGPVCLDKEYNPALYKSCVVTGWGQKQMPDGTTVVPDILQEVTMRVKSIDHALCMQQPSWICAGGDSGSGICVGDSGGPLVCEEDGHYFLAGVVSWGYLPCGNWDGVFTRLSHFTDWIDQQTHVGFVRSTEARMRMKMWLEQCRQAMLQRHLREVKWQKA